jgi:hypothetical protein
MSGIPAIGQINNLADAKRALENLRNWMVSNKALSQLSSLGGLVYIDGKGGISARVPGVDIQEIGGLVVGGSGESVDSTKYYQITVKGTTIKLAVLT